MKNRSVHIKAHLCMATAIFFFAIISPVGKIVLDHVHPLTLNTLRLFGAAICFWITSLFVKEKVSKKDLCALFFAAIFATVLNQGLFIIGLSKTNPVHASLMTSMAPILTLTIAAIYLKEKITAFRIIGVLTGGLGAAILIFMNKQIGDHPSSIAGDVLCLCAQLSYAIYLTVFLKLIKKYKPVTVSKWLFTYAFACYLAISFKDLAADDIFTLPLDIWMRILVIAILCTYVTYTLMMTAQRTISPTIISTYNYFLPLIGAGISVGLGLGTIDLYTVLATLLILGGVLIMNKSNALPSHVARELEGTRSDKSGLDHEMIHELN